MSLETTFAGILAVLAVFLATLRRWWLLLLTIALCLLAGKRGAVIALLAGLVVTFLPFGIKRIVLSVPAILFGNLLGISCVLALGMSGTQQLLQNTFVEDYEQFSMSRAGLYSAAVDRVQEDPTISIVGGGAGYSTKIASKYVSEKQSEEISGYHLHSDVLALFINGGFVFVFAIPLLLYIPVKITFRTIVVPLNVLMLFDNPMQFAHVFIPAIALIAAVVDHEN